MTLPAAVVQAVDVVVLTHLRAPAPVDLGP